jgi:O-antigen/teichoic acid export membrane protein
MQESVLSQKVARGGIWLFSLRFITRGLGFVRTIILARLLMPADFGLVGIALLVISTLDFLSQTGFQSALVQKKECSRAYMDAAWTLLGIRGLVLFLVLFFSAPLISRFFNMPALDLIIRVIAISVVLAGFRNIGIVFFQKELHFNKHFKYEVSGSLVDIIISISLAFLLRNVWAIVWGGLAGNMTRLVVSYWISDYRPRIAFEWLKLRELFSFGKWILGTGIIYSLLVQVDSFTIGKVLGPSDIGYYQMAFLIAFLPSSEISYVVSQLTFPAYSDIQDDPQRMKSAYIDVLRFTSLVSIPLGALIFIVAPEFTELFLGTKWLPAVFCMQILVFSGILMSIASTNLPVFSARGNPEYETYLQMCNLVVLIALVYPLTKFYGIYGTAAALLTANITFTGLSMYTVTKVLDFRRTALAKILAFPLGNAVLMGVTLLAVKHFTADFTVPVQFVVLVVSALLSYSAFSIVVDKLTGFGMMPLVKKKWNMIVRISF